MNIRADLADDLKSIRDVIRPSTRTYKALCRIELKILRYADLIDALDSTSVFSNGLIETIIQFEKDNG